MPAPSDMQPPQPLRSRLTWAELQNRWQWSENDLKEAVIREQLVPLVFEKGPIWPMRLASDGKRTRITPALFSNKWMFAIRVQPKGPFDCNFEFLADTPIALQQQDDVFRRDGSGFVNNQVTLADVIRGGVFRIEDIEQFEATSSISGNATAPTVMGKSLPWWQVQYEIKTMASHFEAKWKVEDKPHNQSGPRAGKFSLSALGEAISAEISKAEKQKNSSKTITGKSIVNYLKSQGWK